MANEQQTETTKPKSKKPASNAGLFQTLDQFGPNVGKSVKQGLLVVVAILALLLIVWQVRAAQANKTAKAYAELSNAATADEFDQVAANNNGKVALQAELAAAQRLFDNGSFKEAAERFAAASASNDATFALRGLLGQAQALEGLAATDKAKLSEAATIFAQAAEKAATLGLSCEQVDALLGQARCERLAGDIEKARKTAKLAKDITSKPDDQLLAYLNRRVETSLGAIDTYELAAPAPVKVDEEPTKAEDEKPAEPKTDN